MNRQCERVIRGRIGLLATAAALATGTLAYGDAFSLTSFTSGDIVVSVEGNGVFGASSGSYTDNQATPLTLIQYALSGTSSAASYAGSLVLPQMASGLNAAVSGEYGSSSEGTLQLSGNGQYLTIMGYGVNAAMFNANPGQYGPDPANTALGQSGSLTGQGYTAVPRVVALIGSNGSVDSTTAITGVFNLNNPRSAYTLDGTNIYISGQGGNDNSGGVFYTTLGSTTATSITGNDAADTGESQDTREVQIYNGQLYVSADSKSNGSTNRDYIGTLGSPGSLPTSLANGGAGPTLDIGTTATGKVTITTGANSDGNSLNVMSGDTKINLSPENYFFANSTTVYVADSGSPKNDSNATTGPPPVDLGDGGLQKWSLISGVWTLDYTLSAGLNLVENEASYPADTDGTTGLYGLTGEVVNGQVELFATNYTIADTDQTWLYGITDTLADTKASQVTTESFTQLATAPADSNFKGVAFAPTAPEPASFALVGLGAGVLFLVRRRKTA